jgi:uncharacterized membrane-anchored protein YitT (DUF2179 family)
LLKNVKQHIKVYSFIIIGVISAGFGLKGFLLPNNFIDGGVTGISLLVTEVTGFPLSILLILVNLPFLILGYKQIGKIFAVRSIVAIFLLAAAVYFVNYPIVTSDKLLISAFGGFFLGTGIGLSVRAGAVLDGTEVLAIYLSKKTGFTIGDIILIFNIFIFAAGAYILSMETALYAILTYFAASKSIDFILDGIEEHVGITIISDKSNDIREMILNKLGHGVTIYKGQKGYSSQDNNSSEIDIIYTVITRLEVTKLQTEIEKIDGKAFIIKNSIIETRGGIIHRKKFFNPDIN